MYMVIFSEIGDRDNIGVLFHAIFLKNRLDNWTGNFTKVRLGRFQNSIVNVGTYSNFKQRSNVFFRCSTNGPAI